MNAITEAPGPADLTTHLPKRRLDTFASLGDYSASYAAEVLKGIPESSYPGLLVQLDDLLAGSTMDHIAALVSKIGWMPSQAGGDDDAQAALEGYYRVLSCLPPHLLGEALMRWERESRWRPMPADLMKAVQEDYTALKQARQRLAEAIHRRPTLNAPPPTKKERDEILAGFEALRQKLAKQLDVTRPPQPIAAPEWRSTPRADAILGRVEAPPQSDGISRELLAFAESRGLVKNDAGNPPQ